MINDNEPDQLASIAVSRDEIAQRQRVTVPVRKTETHNGTNKPWLSWALLFIALMAIGYLFLQLQSMQQLSDKQIMAMEKLQGMLLSSDEQSSLSVDALNIMVKNQDLEIRKLWDLANKRNKKDIAKQKEKVDDQAKLITQQQARLKKQHSSLQKLESSLKKLQTTLQKQTDSMVSLEQVVLSSQEKTAKSIVSVDEKTSRLESEMKKVNKQLPASLNKDLKQFNKAIKAMDATRLQHNKRISKIEKDIKALRSQSPPATVSN